MKNVKETLIMAAIWLVLIMAAATMLHAQSGECYDPNTGQNCGQCYVTGKTCQSGAGHCPDPTCEWCQKIVRTEFCGIFLLAPACWCFGLDTATCKETSEAPLRAILRQKAKNRLAMKGVRPWIAFGLFLPSSASHQNR